MSFVGRYCTYERESAYLTLATAQLHGQTLRQIVFIRIATNVKYALSRWVVHLRPTLDT